MKDNIRKWMVVSGGVPNLLGFMYTTWNKDYVHMKEYFQLLDTYDAWGKAAPAPAGR